MKQSQNKELLTDIQTCMEFILSWKFDSINGQGFGMFFPVITTLLHSGDSNTVGYGWRLLRYLCCHDTVLNTFISKNGLFLLLNSMYKDKIFLWERIQAFKFVRLIIEMSPQSVSNIIVSSLISIADEEEDTLHQIALESLRLYASYNCTNLVFSTLLKSCLSISNYTLIEPVIFTILTVLQDPHNRAKLNYEGELSIILGPYTSEYYCSESQKETVWKCCKQCLSTIMKYKRNYKIDTE